MDIFNGVPVVLNESLPCPKSEAICFPKANNVNREFWYEESGDVWGFIEHTAFNQKIHLSKKALDKIKSHNAAVSRVY